MFSFEHELDHKLSVQQYFGSGLGNIVRCLVLCTHAHSGVKQFLQSVCLVVKKITPNRDLSVVRDGIKDTNGYE